jgi:hypothetical protein
LVAVVVLQHRVVRAVREALRPDQDAGGETGADRGVRERVGAATTVDNRGRSDHGVRVARAAWHVRHGAEHRRRHVAQHVGGEIAGQLDLGLVTDDVALFVCAVDAERIALDRIVLAAEASDAAGVRLECEGPAR